MSKNESDLEKIGNRNPFKTPEGYFERLTDQIMAQLPERVEQEPQVLSLWERMKPWAYMAAMFVGIALMIKVFVGSPVPNGTALNFSSPEEIEEYYDYYEDQLASNIYHEAIFVNSEWDIEDYEFLK